MKRNSPLNLDNFFPYQLTQLQALVSDSIAQIYTGKFNLSRQEWRILAVLANSQPLTAKQIGDKTNLEKMPASRAIKRMSERSLVVKDENRQDKRSSLLCLTTKGVELYKELEPMVLEREQEVLSTLTSDEKTSMQQILTKLTNQVTKLL